MTKVRIRQAVAKKRFPRWNLVTFLGEHGGEPRGVVDLIAIRKDHSRPRSGLKLGDDFQMVLVQVKGGRAAMPTDKDRDRLRIVASRHGGCPVLLAAWKKGKAAQFFSLLPSSAGWSEVPDLSAVFG
jgi:hypothetical protein